MSPIAAVGVGVVLGCLVVAAGAMVASEFFDMNLEYFTC